ncbi:MAG TPA: hypothetical protein VEU51_05185, partial [Candidatus Acidoferrales bacterium]|nr:hypothetical protein [Candidatus Acidoferrales bacterium]
MDDQGVLKIRHATALALVGWTLVLTTSGGPFSCENFRLQSECEKARVSAMKKDGSVVCGDTR